MSSSTRVDVALPPPPPPPPPPGLSATSPSSYPGVTVSPQSAPIGPRRRGCCAEEEPVASDQPASEVENSCWLPPAEDRPPYSDDVASSSPASPPSPLTPIGRRRRGRIRAPRRGSRMKPAFCPDRRWQRRSSQRSLQIFFGGDGGAPVVGGRRPSPATFPRR